MQMAYRAAARLGRWSVGASVPGVGTLRALARNQMILNQFVPSFWEGPAAITRGASGRCIVESSRELT